MAINSGMWKKVVNYKNHVEYESIAFKKYRFVGDVSGMRATRMWVWTVQVRGNKLDGSSSSTLEDALYAASRVVQSYETKRGAP